MLNDPFLLSKTAMKGTHPMAQRARAPGVSQLAVTGKRFIITKAKSGVPRGSCACLLSSLPNTVGPEVQAQGRRRQPSFWVCPKDSFIGSAHDFRLTRSRDSGGGGTCVLPLQTLRAVLVGREHTPLPDEPGVRATVT